MKLLTTLLLALLITGCTTVDHTFEEASGDLVWRSLIAVAETPDYSSEDPADRWFVKENAVWVDEATARIEVYRELERVLHRAQAKPLHEERTWRFQVLYVEGPPPVARFISRGWGVPAQGREEAKRYFEDVEAVLAGTMPDSDG